MTSDPFLKQLATNLFSTYGKNITDLTLVFPNRRAGLFFSRYLAEISDNVLFAPEIITIQELFSNFSNLILSEKLDLIFDLYHIQKSCTGSDETFDQFYYWGEMLLSDFDQADKYLVPAEELFVNITNLHEIDEHFDSTLSDEKEFFTTFWNSIQGNTTTGAGKFVKIWKKLSEIYLRFTQLLLKERRGYEGLIFKQVVEQDQLINHPYFVNRHFIVAGFNALNSCEKKLFDLLRDSNQAHFFWDTDPWYMNDRRHEAGRFMRDNCSRYPSSMKNDESGFLQNKKIEIVQLSSRIAQTRYTAQLLSEYAAQNRPLVECAVVLCDEELLLPVISSIPHEIKNINVTMGLSVKNTTLFSLIQSSIDLHKSYTTSGIQHGFYYRDVIRLIENPLIQLMSPIGIKLLKEEISKKNLIYINSANEISDPFLSLFLIRPDSIQGYIDYYQNILRVLYEKSQDQDLSLIETVRPFITRVSVMFNRIQKIVSSQKYGTVTIGSSISKETFFKILLQFLNEISIPFEGEPVQGIQIMGVLETRTLDFDHLIMLSVNEGIIPRSGTGGSFIPYNLRKAFHLPTIDEQNAIYAYYFYRSIQRTSRVTFLYDKSSGGLKSGEKSRFLYQLLLGSGLNIEEKVMKTDLSVHPKASLIVKKNQKVLDLLNNHNRFSPSALNIYISCELQFYFKYIAKIKTDDEFSDDIDAASFGTITHRVLETLYTPFLNKEVHADIIETLMKDDSVEHQLDNALKEILFPDLDSDRDSLPLLGKNILVKEVIHRMVKQTLERDKMRTPFSVIFLEKKLSMGIQAGTKTILIEGTIDRVDRRGGAIELIDYKTGNASLDFKSVDELFDRGPANSKRNKAVFQTLIYSSLFANNEKRAEPLMPGIYLLKSIFKEKEYLITLNKSEFNYSMVSEEFNQQLNNLLLEIFDENVPFKQTEDIKTCKYCDFKSICQR